MLDTVIHKNESHGLKMQRDLVVVILYGSICKQYKTVKMILAILYFYNFMLVIDTTVQNNNNEISLHFKPMRLIFMNYSV